ncbi:hypothetical protein MKX08_003236 [Trichoderma sp. CBMAI-0020]|nr:hypothetical protein MKX08_003236 [Trichoderma sp. CBMAI-0020]
MANIPKHHRQPGPLRKACETGPPSHVVIMLGEDASIVKRRCVGYKNVDAVEQGAAADGAKDLGCCVHFNAGGHGHHDEANGYDEQRQAIALRPAKDVEDLGHGQVAHAADDAAEDAHRWGQRMIAEGRRDVRREDRGRVLLHQHDKVDDPDEDVGDDEICPRPHHGDGLNLLDAGLCILAVVLLCASFVQLASGECAVTTERLAILQ